MLMEKVKKTVRKYGMLKKGEFVLVAVSGGVDSAVLLHALNALKDGLCLTLAVGHMNHNLRGAESKRDFLFVKKLAGKMGLEFAGRTLKPGELERRGESLQAAAREKRLGFLTEVAGMLGAARIALGHNADDQAETVLMRLLKGSGLRGLSGIPPKRDRVIRPLIECSREEIERYAFDNKIKCVTDSSNLNVDYLRNDVRKRLIPFIKKYYNPNITGVLARTAGILREDDGFMAAAAAAALSDAAVERKKSFISLDASRLCALHPAISKRVFLSAVEFLKSDREVYSAHAGAFLDIIKGGSPSASFALPGGIILKRVYGTVVISKAQPAQRRPGRYDVPLKTPGTARIKGASLAITATVLRKLPAKGLKDNANAAYFDLDALPGPLRARPVKPGDRIVPFGMRGHKKLKEILIEKKIPVSLRPLVPVVYAGTEIVWLAGLKRSDMFKVTKRTKKILRLRLAGGVEISGNI